MMMTRDTLDRQKILPEEIRRQFGSVGTTRFLHALPSLQVQPGVPDRFQHLLTELDRAEAEPRNAPLRGDQT